MQRCTDSDVLSGIKPILQELVETAENMRGGSQIVQGICHGDAWRGNAINWDGTAVLFDFEFSGTGPIAYDIATFIWALRAERACEETESFRAFVEGYRSEYDIHFDQIELTAHLHRREVHNVHFLCKHIELSRELKLAMMGDARDTLAFALNDGMSQFRWH